MDNQQRLPVSNLSKTTMLVSASDRQKINDLKPYLTVGAWVRVLGPKNEKTNKVGSVKEVVGDKVWIDLGKKRSELKSILSLELTDAPEQQAVEVGQANEFLLEKKGTFAERIAIALLWNDLSYADKELGDPGEEIYLIVEQLAKEFKNKPKVEARTVYVKEGIWEDAVAVFKKVFSDVSEGGSAQSSNRVMQASFPGMGVVLREVSKSSHEINATIELQIGKHHIEYKWKKPQSEIEKAELQVLDWDSTSEEVRRLEEIIYQEFACKEVSKVDRSDLVAGSHGLKQVELYKKLSEFPCKDFFKPGAWALMEQLQESIALLFLNRNFTGARLKIREPREEGSEIMEDKVVTMDKGYAQIDHIESYVNKKINKIEKDLIKMKAQPPEILETLTKTIEELDAQKEEYESIKKSISKLKEDKQFSIEKEGPGMGGGIKLISVEGLFWDRFQKLSEPEQIRIITDSTTNKYGSKSPIERANELHYVDNSRTKDLVQGTERVTELKISEVTFRISSEHAYKFHEQGVDSHPGIAGTQKEIEFAIMCQALQRYRAKALPSRGAVGSIAESKYAVIVNGIEIVYLAWTPSQESNSIYISDYMVKPQKR